MKRTVMLALLAILLCNGRANALWIQQWPVCTTLEEINEVSSMWRSSAKKKAAARVFLQKESTNSDPYFNICWLAEEVWVNPIPEPFSDTLLDPGKRPDVHRVELVEKDVCRLVYTFVRQTTAFLKF